MRSIRSKKIKNETSKYVIGPYDDSLIQIQLDKNEKCIQEVSKENFQRAAQFLRQIRTDGEMISASNRDKIIIKCLSLNSEAYLYQKQKKFELALKCLEQAEQLQTANGPSAVDLARTKLNKSVILSHLGNHAESVLLAQQALDLLKQRRNNGEFELRKNQFKLYEIMIVSFYNIASELSKLSDAEGSNRVYKEGYYLAQRMLGPQHKLTLLLKSIIKSHNQSRSKSKQKIEISSIGSQKSLDKANYVFKNQLFPFNISKEKQLKRIYAPKRNSHSQAHRDKYLTNDTSYYLRSLERLKETGRRKSIQPYGTQLIFKQKHTGKIRKLHTQSSNPNRYQEVVEHQKIKDIILNGKTINKSHVYSTINRSHPTIIQKEKSLPKIKLAPTQPAPPPAEPPKIVDEKPKPKQEESACQLI